MLPLETKISYRMLPMETSGKKKKSLARPRKKAVGEYRHGDLRNAVLDAAAILVAQRAGPDFSLREIAERVGVQHTAIYRHFVSKEAILSALAARAFERLSARFEIARQACLEDAHAYLDALADAYFDTVRQEPGAYRVMFMRKMRSEPERDSASGCCFQALVEGFARCQALGIVRNDQSAVAVATVNWAAMHGLALLILDQRLEDPEKFGEQSFLHAAMRQILREGWLAEPGNSGSRSKKPPRK
jgi:AcrR family transcriptional regulator